MLFVSPAWAALEDYTTYTTVDNAGTGTLTVTAQKIDLQAEGTSNYAAKANEDYTYHDMGAGSITAVSHDLEITVTASDNWMSLCIWGITNDVADYRDWTTGVYVKYYHHDGTHKLYITDVIGQDSGVISLGAASFPETLYLTVKRYDDIAAVYVYSDDTRATQTHQANVRIPTTAYQYIYAFSAYDTGGATDKMLGSIENLEFQTAPDSAIPPPPFSPAYYVAPNQPAGTNRFGGWTSLSSANPEGLAGNIPDSVTGLQLTDTGAFTGKDYSWHNLQPDINQEVYFIIQDNTDDILRIVPYDRLDNDVITNGTMEADANWASLAGTDTNERSSTREVYGTYSRHVVGSAAGEGIEQTSLAFDLKEDNCTTDHTSGWTGDYTAIGYVWVVSGTVYLKAIDGDGSTEIKDVQIGTTAGGKWEDFEVTNIDTDYAGGCGAGKVEFYCHGGACEFYVDEVVIGEYDYGYYNAYTALNDYNNGTSEYKIYGNIRGENIANRLWWIDPLDDVFIAKGLNNFSTLPGSLKGVDFNGRGINTNMNTKYGDQTSGTQVQNRMERVWELGFNFLGEYMDTYAIPGKYNYQTLPQIPVILLTELDQWTLTNVGALECRGTWQHDQWPDVFDVDWPTMLDACHDTDDCFDLDSDSIYYNSAARCCTSGEYDSNFYKDAALHIMANNYIFGWDMCNEIRGTGMGWGHQGFYHFCSTEVVGGGTNYTKISIVNRMRAKYTEGGETTFCDNIDYGGSDEITTVASWSGVTGYTAGKDAAALTLLNTAWGSTYTAWSQVLAENCDDDYGIATLSDCPSNIWNCKFRSSCSNGSCNQGCNAAFLVDIEENLEHYSRKLHSTLYDSFFGPDGLFHGMLNNFSLGFDGWSGWFAGMQSEDGNTQYVKIAQIRGQLGDGFTTGLDMSWEDAEQYAYPTRDVYTETLRDCHDALPSVPFYIETFITASGLDTQLGFGGTVDAIHNYNDADDRPYYGGWDCDAGAYGSIASYCSTSTEDYRIADDATLYWNCSDPTNTGTCSDTAPLHWFWINEVDKPNSGLDGFGDQYALIVPTASIGNLADNDVVTTGTKMFTINGTPTAQSIFIDEDANFDTDYDNPRALNAQSARYLVLWNKTANPVTRAWKMRMNKTTRRSVPCWKHLDATTGWSGAFACTFDTLSVGDSYSLGFGVVLETIPTTSLDNYFPVDTQEDRAALYISYWREALDLAGSDGVKFWSGMGLWAPWPYGFEQDSVLGDEIKCWGLFSQMDNELNGVENTMVGADGMPDTWDDEPGDYGNFTGSVGVYLVGMFDELLTKWSTFNGVTLNGVQIQ